MEFRSCERKNYKLSGYLCFGLKIFLILLPVFWGTYVVWKYGVNVAFWDEIDEMRYLLNEERCWTLDYLWSQHNEHRIFFPKLLVCVIGNLFAWNSKVFMYTSQVMLFLVYALIIRLILDGKKLNKIKWNDVLIIVCIGLCVYNIHQHENIFWGFQTAWFMIVSFGAWSYYLFSRYVKAKRTVDLFGAMFLAVVVSFSSLHGLAVWSGYILILIDSLILKEKLSAKASLTVFGTCVVSVFLYFFDWQPISQHEVLYAGNLDRMLSFFLGEVGESIIPYREKACNYVAFILVFSCALWMIKCVRQKAFIENIAFWGPMIMGLSAMLFVSFGRGSVSLVSVPSRYLSNSMIFLAFFMLICLKTFREGEPDSKSIVDCFLNRKRSERSGCQVTKIAACSAAILFVGISVLLVIRNSGWQKIGESYYSSRMEVKNTLLNYQSLNINDYQCIWAITDDNIDECLSLFDKMREERLNAFSELPNK